MIKDGLYSVHFSSPLGAGSGVVVISGNTFRGGDAGIAYVGSLWEQDGEINASLRTFRHAQVQDQISVLGSDETQIELQGRQENAEQFTLAAPSSGLEAVLSWLQK